MRAQDLPERVSFRRAERVAVAIALLLVLCFGLAFFFVGLPARERFSGLSLYRGEGEMELLLREARQGPASEGSLSLARLDLYLDARREALKRLHRGLREEADRLRGRPESVVVRLSRLALAGRVRAAYVRRLAEGPMRPEEGRAWGRLLYGEDGTRPYLIPGHEAAIGVLVEPRLDRVLYAEDAAAVAEALSP